MNMGMIVP